MVDQIGYRKPHDFIGKPPGQWGTKGSTRDCKGTVRVPRGPFDGPWWTIQGHEKRNRTMGDHGGPYRTIGGQYGALKDRLP